MSKKTWMYLAVGLVAYGGYMWWRSSKKMKLSDVKK
jgi:hypothetical protein